MNSSTDSTSPPTPGREVPGDSFDFRPHGSKEHYSAISRWLHWLMALFVLGMLASGLSLDWLSPAQKPQVLFWHMSFGVTVLGLALLRMLVRLATTMPTPLPTSYRVEQLAADSTHAILYILMVLLPLSGWLMISAMDRPVTMFGLFSLPHIIAPDRALGIWFKTRHWQLAYGMLGLIGIHIAAVLYHQLIRRDGTLRRMWPEKR